MLRGQPVNAIIPVRGGSKGIPGKNLRAIGGRSLLERAIALGMASKRVDRVIVSTDDPGMHAVASKYGVASPSLRPAELATDTATAKAVVEHVIAECDIEKGFLLLLQATSPLRTHGDLERLFDVFETNDADAVVSVVSHDEPRPEKLKRIEDGWLKPYMGDGFEGPRQSLPLPYALNGAFYFVSLDAFRREGKFLPKRTLAFVMPRERSHNLDSVTDWQILEAMVQAGHWKLEDLPL